MISLETLPARRSSYPLPHALHSASLEGDRGAMAGSSLLIKEGVRAIINLKYAKINI